ncbi:MAG: tyrosine recombinase XerC [Acidobacteriales bacterium]|nr:MAG: tyrosine recombinase XerC [Terriglobales bacterium]
MSDSDAGARRPSPLQEQISRFLESRRRENLSEHTLRAYASDLRQFHDSISALDSAPPAPEKIDLLTLRRWLAGLYHQNLSPVSLRRKVAAVRSFYRFMVRENVVPINTARLLGTPKAPQTVPRVMTAEQASNLLDSTAASEGRRQLARDVAILEMLYGCGLRVSELTGLNLDDIDFAGRWLLVRGKGRKERQVPCPSQASAALERYLPERRPVPQEKAVFLNRRGARLTVRSIRNIVKFYATLLAGDASIHPHSFRHAYATHLLSDGAELRSIQELLGHARLSTTQKYTKVSLSDLMAVYDRSHPKA